MRPAKLWLSVFAVGAVLITALLLVTLLTPTPTGALTRIAEISDHEFRGQAPEPEIPYARIQQSEIAQADILIVGDSFSNYFAWQTELVAAGYRVATTHWDWVSPVCADFAPWLQSQGFKGRLVLLQSIEYLMPERLAAMRKCSSMPATQRLKLSPPPLVSPSPPPPVPQFNTQGRLMSGLNTWRHTQRIKQSNDVQTFDADRLGPSVFSAPFEGGCREFSHRLCEKNLFLLMDRTNPELQAADAEFMHAFSERSEPLMVRWMMIPNKTTVYLDRTRAEAFAQRARDLAIGPDLFTVAQLGRSQVTDLYWPNDNHWSMKGQLYFGRHMLDYVRDTLGVPASSR